MSELYVPFIIVILFIIIILGRIVPALLDGLKPELGVYVDGEKDLLPTFASSRLLTTVGMF